MELSTPPRDPRILGLDFARCLAILGMVLINFTYVVDTEHDPEWLLFFIGIVQGRASAIFVVLAGVGISLLTRRARAQQDPALIFETRIWLLRRAAFLLLLGLILLPLWHADILHYYALYIAFTAIVFNASSRTLWCTAAGSILIFSLLHFFLDYEGGWKMNTSDDAFFTILGNGRRMFFSGYYPFFPWISFVMAGLWLGRQDLLDGTGVKKLLWTFLAIGLCAQFISWGLVGLSDFVDIDEEKPLIDTSFWGTDPFPPGPLYMISSMGFAVSIIVLSVQFAAAYPDYGITKLFSKTGRMALTVYFAHAVAGIPIVQYVGDLFIQSGTVATIGAIFFSLLSILFATCWSRRHERGPLEAVMRGISD